MNDRRRAMLSVALLAISGSPAPGDAAGGGEPVLAAMAAELQRSVDAYALQDEPLYYLAYEVAETDRRSISSAFGHALERREERSRQLDVDLRVGSPELDNTRALRGARGSGFQGPRYDYLEMPVEDDEAAIRALLWRATDRKYREAVEALRAVRTNVRVKVEVADSSPDFSAAPAVVFRGPEPELTVDLGAWEQKLDLYTAPFAADPAIYQGEARFTVARETRWFANSEGSRIRTTRLAFRLDIRALTKAEDGMELPLHETFFSYSEQDMPSDLVVLERVEEMVRNLAALRQAPLVEPYTGPAILSGRAAGVFFHEVFGHRIEGHRQKIEQDGQTFKSKVGEAILPSSFAVVFDPTLQEIGGHDLAGHYLFDNEGVAARRVDVVEAGRFRHFLMSRSPIAGEPHSNGHGRRQPGFPAVARQSNLLVQVSEPLGRAELKKRLLEIVTSRGKPFGLLFEDIQGGFTLTGRRAPNAFNVLPILVYKVFSDGSEELVRGVDLIGTPLTAFSQITAAAEGLEVFNGTCGAESGGVPVAAAAPPILVAQIEVQRKEKSQERPPLLPSPRAGGERQ